MSELIVSALGLGVLYLISNQKEKKCETMKNRPYNIKEYTGKNIEYQSKDNWYNNIKNPNIKENNINNYKNNEWASKIYTTNNIKTDKPKNIEEKQYFNCNNKGISNNFKSLTGANINQNDFKHNNMKPYYNGKFKPINLNDNHVLENKIGASNIKIEKKSIAPLFKQEKNLTYAYGTPNYNDFYKERTYVSNRKDNYKPWEEVRVGPGLNKYDTVNGSLGFNSSMEARDVWKPKNIDELRVLTNPKKSYSLKGKEGPAYDTNINPGALEGKSKILLGKMEKNRPERFHENCDIENWGNARGINKNTYRSKQMLPEENRNCYNKEYYGPGKTNNNKQIINGNYREASKVLLPGSVNHVRVSNINNKNIHSELRQSHSFSHNARTTTKNERNGLLNGIFKAAIAPILDIIKPSKKEELIQNNRMDGVISGGYNKQRVWDPNTALRTTIKEQTSLNKYASQPSLNLGKGYTTNEHQPVQNQRDTTNKPYTALPKQNYGKGYLAHEHQPIKNQRDTTNMSYVSQANKSNGVGYLSNDYQPVENQRDTTNIFIIGGAGATKSTLKTTKTDALNTRPLPNKEECSKSRPNPGNMSLFNNKINYQQLGNKCTYQSMGFSNMPKQVITNDNFGKQRFKNNNNQNINTNRMEGNILKSFNNNPYTHSLASI